MKELQITGASAVVNRAFEHCGDFQWARELLQNAIEAKATKVDFDVEWQAVKSQGVYRRAIMDNGHGMDKQELEDFFSTLGMGSKMIHGVHDNFGIGAKVATLPWNPDGLVVVSYKDGVGSLLWVMYNDEYDKYILREWETSDGIQLVVDPNIVDFDGVNWGKIKPSWIKEHGTIVVLVGSEEHPDTFLGNPAGNEGETRGLSRYLNSRFWEFGNIDVRVVEARTPRDRWPVKGMRDSKESYFDWRRIHGARHWITTTGQHVGKPKAKGMMKVANDRVDVQWFLREGITKQNYNAHCIDSGYIALKYKNELYHITQSLYDFRDFGIVDREVQRNVTLILDAPHCHGSKGAWGVLPDQSRNRLAFTGDGEKGIDVPADVWGGEFSDHMPQEIVDAIHSVRSGKEGTLQDDAYRKRIADKWGDRFKKTIWVRASEKKQMTMPGREIDEVSISKRITKRITNRAKSGAVKRSRQRRIILTHEGDPLAQKKEAPADVPRYKFIGKDNFSKPYHVAMWQPNDVDGPTVYLNSDAPLFKEVVDYHLPRYATHHGEEVKNIVECVYGEIAVTKVAHAQQLMKDVNESELDSVYRSEEALTLSLMGLMAEESLIARRLVHIGKRKVMDNA